uniref:Uncharacterized protein n=1 Tax=viral metagenome TaxID=1070528 RepID=A0A6M3M051_9ZZZZ
MAEIIARFADGRLLVQEERAVAQNYLSGGVRVRIGNVKTIEKVLSIDNWISGYGDTKVMTHLRDVSISGDTLLVLMRRADLGVPTMAATGTGFFSGVMASGLASGILSGLSMAISGYTTTTVTLTGPIGSGAAALSVLSGITSGLYRYQELTSGRPVSGKLQILANIIGF